MRTQMLAGLIALASYATLEAQEGHVTFLVIGKTTNHRQSVDIAPSMPKMDQGQTDRN